ncbi:MAG: hypothetical protein DMG76_10450 [Acidobacteria bacterium]|nr:MAG: hypothetical protein DMG76_10450 [Acidobacteriota bacterium]
MEKNRIYSFNRILLAHALCFLWTVNGMAQINEANLNGTVTDTSGARVLNAKVRLLKVDTGLTRETITGPGGVYSISSLPVGKYTLTISHEGFKTYAEMGIELFVGQTRTVDAQLRVGAATTTVDVEAQVQALDSSNAEIAGVVQSKQVEDIPLNGRNWSTLALLTPGAVNIRRARHGRQQLHLRWPRCHWRPGAEPEGGCAAAHFAGLDRGISRGFVAVYRG